MFSHPAARTVPQMVTQMVFLTQKKRWCDQQKIFEGKTPEIYTHFGHRFWAQILGPILGPPSRPFWSPFWLPFFVLPIVLAGGLGPLVFDYFLFLDTGSVIYVCAFLWFLNASDYSCAIY